MVRSVLLDLAYHPAMPASLRLAIARAGRRYGVPLETLDRLAGSLDEGKAFADAARRGDHAALRRLTGMPRLPAPPPLLQRVRLVRAEAAN
jgi:hypothetical protein